jgi:diguanylate cyclase (GGDEF)-like protein/PAS domain S-box-containing protein
MNKVSSISKISLALVMLTLSIMIIADALFGFSSDRLKSLLDGRKQFCETLAIQSTLLIQQEQTELLKDILKNISERNDDIVSIALRQHDGNLLLDTGNHVINWPLLITDNSTIEYAQVPIYNGPVYWGMVEVNFKWSQLLGILRLLQNPFTKLLIFMGVAGFFTYLVFMKKTLKQLDPDAVIPERVKSAMNGLIEGIILIDTEGQIVLANNPFAVIMLKTPEALLGKYASDLNFSYENESNNESMPWDEVMRKGKPQVSIKMLLNKDTDIISSFIVNCAPIYGDEGDIKGALASFHDVTELEKKNIELNETLSTLESSRKQILEQNKKLTVLATRDPLTGCLNRRAFFDKLDKLYYSLADNNRSVSCIMADIDHFKSFNDTYGHAVGDQVIQIFTKALSSALRANDFICRYGGEEFCIILIDADKNQSNEIAERMRHIVETKCGAGIRTTAGLKITASFGVTCSNHGASNPTELIEQADTALYKSKEDGRNCVRSWPLNNNSDDPQALRLV